MHGEAQVNPQSEEKIKELKRLSELRKERAIAILHNGKPTLLDKNTYLVPSSDGKHSYKVTHYENYSCECKDFKERCLRNGLFCKHINAIIIFSKLKNTVELQDYNIEKEINKEVCFYCNSENIFKRGTRTTKIGTKQLYCCKDCNRRFTIDAIKYIKGNAKLVCLAMDCYYKGNSLRDIQDMFKQFYNLEVSHETVRRWIVRFTKIMEDYTRELKPQVSDRWHIDEQKIKVGKEWLWSWNAIDKDTKFWIANNVTEQRSIKDARTLLKQTKENIKEIPKHLEIVTDGLHSYKKAIKKEFKTHKDRLNRPYNNSVLHIGKAGIRKPINNNMVERLNGEFREFDKVRRGFYAKDTAQDNLNGMRLYHNFIKKNMALNGLSPYEKANIDLKLENNRWLSLLNKSIKATQVTKQKETKESH